MIQGFTSTASSSEDLLADPRSVCFTMRYENRTIRLQHLDLDRLTEWLHRWDHLARWIEYHSFALHLYPGRKALQRVDAFQRSVCKVS